MLEALVIASGLIASTYAIVGIAIDVKRLKEISKISEQRQRGHSSNIVWNISGPKSFNVDRFTVSMSRSDFRESSTNDMVAPRSK